MDRVFLDANVLFSVAYRGDSGLARIWSLSETELVTSDYALCEAARNLTAKDQHDRLQAFMSAVALCADLPSTGILFSKITLPEKDWPILLAALESRCTHLVTGDRRHFGHLYQTKVEGVLIQSPRQYLDSVSKRPKDGQSH